jgi:hypothetical protein
MAAVRSLRRVPDLITVINEPLELGMSNILWILYVLESRDLVRMRNFEIMSDGCSYNN